MGQYALIMAGGLGTRLWPMSRKRSPKQLLPFGPGGKSLLRVCVDRLETVFAPGNIYIITGESQLPAIRQAAPELPESNFIGEPQARDTANAIGLGCAIIAHRDADATVGVFTADQIIDPVDHFAEVVRAGFSQIEANPNCLGTFGIKPLWAHPGLGYIQRGEELASGPVPIYKVKAFVEKPDPETASRYLDSGEFYWNSGMFVWKADAILKQLRSLLPNNAKLVTDLARHWGTDKWTEQAKHTFDQLEKISIDYAVMEKAKDVIVIEMACNWADVGSWGELQNVTGVDDNGNAALAKMLELKDSTNNVVASSDPDHLISAIGVQNLIIIHTSDATLVCAKDQAQKIKELVATLEDTYDGQRT